MSGNNTNSIVVDFAPNASSGNMSVYGTNACGNGTPSSNLSITVVPLVPVTRILNNIVVSSGQLLCYNASQTITVAGNNTTFQVLTGGSVTMIAGQNVDFLPTTTVQPGGYLHAYITTTATYCTNPAVPGVITPGDVTEGTPGVDPINSEFIKVYPNPTTGRFFLEVKTTDADPKLEVMIYSMMGEMICKEKFSGDLKKEYSLEDRPVGIYIVKVVGSGHSGIIKVIKQ